MLNTNGFVTLYDSCLEGEYIKMVTRNGKSTINDIISKLTDIERPACRSGAICRQVDCRWQKQYIKLLGNVGNVEQQYKEMAV